MKKPYSILVNTCDNFEDCWNPFFQLWTKYWNDCQGKIYLNTEYKEYQYSGLDIVSTQVCKKNNFPRDKRATWSQCLKWALEQMDTDIVLYMQEDYFLKDKVKNDLIEEYIQLMNDNQDIHCIQLTSEGCSADKKSKYKSLFIVPKDDKNRISCQAALWRKNVLIEYIRTYESAWNFEWWGSKRASKFNHNFYVVDKNWVKLDEFEIIPYLFTGVIGGKWYKPVVELFQNNNIYVDFTKRGFYESKKITTKERIINKLKRLPVELRNLWELLFLKA